MMMTIFSSLRLVRLVLISSFLLTVTVAGAVVAETSSGKYQISLRSTNNHNNDVNQNKKEFGFEVLPFEQQQQQQEKQLDQLEEHEVNNNNDHYRMLQYMISFSQDDATFTIPIPFLINLYETSSSTRLSSNALFIIQQGTNDFLMNELNQYFNPYAIVTNITTTITYLQSIQIETSSPSTRRRTRKRQLQTTTKTGSQLQVNVDITFEQEPAPNSENQIQALTSILNKPDTTTNLVTSIIQHPTMISDVNGELSQLQGSEVILPTSSSQEEEEEDDEDGDDEDDDKDDEDDNSTNDSNISQANTAITVDDDSPDQRSLKALYPSIIVGIIVFCLTAICIAVRRRHQIANSSSQGTTKDGHPDYFVEGDDIEILDDNDDDYDGDQEGEGRGLDRNNISQYDPHRNVESIRMGDGRTVVHVPGSGYRGGRLDADGVDGPSSSRQARQQRNPGVSYLDWNNPKELPEYPVTPEEGQQQQQQQQDQFILSTASSYETTSDIPPRSDYSNENISKLLESANQQRGGGGGRGGFEGGFGGGGNSSTDTSGMSDSVDYHDLSVNQSSSASAQDESGGNNNGFCGLEHPCSR